MPFRGSSIISDTDTTATDSGDSPKQTYPGDKVKHRRTSKGESRSFRQQIAHALVQHAISAGKVKASATIQVTVPCRVAAAFCLVTVSFQNVTRECTLFTLVWVL